MALIDSSTLRDRVRTAVDAVAGTSESRFHPDLFAHDVDQLIHKSFAVDLTENQAETTDGRQYAAAGAYSGSILRVQVAYRIRGDATNTDISAAYDFEKLVRAAVYGISRASINMRYQATQRRIVEGVQSPWQLSEITFRIFHHLPLA